VAINSSRLRFRALLGTIASLWPVSKPTGDVQIVADGDLDAVTAVHILRHALPDAELQFPAPWERKGLELQPNAVLVELNPESWGIYAPHPHVVIDHHAGLRGAELRLSPNIKLYVDINRLSIQKKDIVSAADIAHALTAHLDVTPSIQPQFLRLVAALDNGILDVREEIAGEEVTAEELYNAYRARVASIRFQGRPPPQTLLSDVEEIGVSPPSLLRWIAHWGGVWKTVEGRVAQLAASAAVNGGAVVFTYNPKSFEDTAAFRQAMLRLEDRYPTKIVVAVRETGDGVSFATKTLDLTPLYQAIRRIPGVRSAGGRDRVGAAQVEDPKAIEKIIGLLTSFPRGVST